MTTDLKLYRYEESMDDETLEAMGIPGGLLGQAVTDVEFENRSKLLQNAEGQIVGNAESPFGTRMKKAVNDLQLVDETFLATVRTAAEEYEGQYNEEVVEWLEEQKGNKIFMKAL